MKDKDYKIGEINYNSKGYKMKLIDIVGNGDVIIEFENTKEKIKCHYIDFKKGNVKSHFSPSLYGVGIVGLEKCRDENGKVTKCYETWKGMLRRCYSKKIHDKEHTYEECEVCEEWKLFSNFKKWYDENYYQIDNDIMALDKDILHKNNKIYSPDNCVFVNQVINNLFTKSNKNRGDLPIGVKLNNNFIKSKNKDYSKKYEVMLSWYDFESKNKKRGIIGYSDNIETAFKIYKKSKEENIKRIADHYKEQIPEKLYNAMYNYEVEITD